MKYECGPGVPGIRIHSAMEVHICHQKQTVRWAFTSIEGSLCALAVQPMNRNLGAHPWGRRLSIICGCLSPTTLTISTTAAHLLSLLGLHGHELPTLHATCAIECYAISEAKTVPPASGGHRINSGWHEFPDIKMPQLNQQALYYNKAKGET